MKEDVVRHKKTEKYPWMCVKDVAEQQCLLHLSVLQRASHIISASPVMYRDLDIDSALFQGDACLQNILHETAKVKITVDASFACM